MMACHIRPGELRLRRTPRRRCRCRCRCRFALKCGRQEGSSDVGARTSRWPVAGHVSSTIKSWSRSPTAPQLSMTSRAARRPARDPDSASGSPAVVKRLGLGRRVAVRLAHVSRPRNGPREAWWAVRAWRGRRPPCSPDQPQLHPVDPALTATSKGTLARDVTHRPACVLLQSTRISWSVRSKVVASSMTLPLLRQLSQIALLFVFGVTSTHPIRHPSNGIQFRAVAIVEGEPHDAAGDRCQDEESGLRASSPSMTRHSAQASAACGGCLPE